MTSAKNRPCSLTLLHSEKAKIAYNFGLSECNRVKLPTTRLQKLKACRSLVRQAFQDRIISTHKLLLLFHKHSFRHFLLVEARNLEYGSLFHISSFCETLIFSFLFSRGNNFNQRRVLPWPWLKYGHGLFFSHIYIHLKGE